MRKSLLTILFFAASIPMIFAQTGTMLADVYVVDQYGGYVVCFEDGQPEYPVRPGDKISPKASLELSDGATIKLYHEHMGKATLYTVTDATATNPEGKVDVNDVLASGEGETIDTDWERVSDDEETDDGRERRGYINKYWQKVGQAVANAEKKSSGVYGWARGPEKSGALGGPIKGYGKRFSDARAQVNQQSLSGELPYEDVCFTWIQTTREIACLKIADLNGHEIFAADVKGSEMCVDLKRLALDFGKAYTWTVTACESGKVISKPVKFKVVSTDARAATLSDMRGYAGIKGYAGVSDGSSECDNLKVMLMEASALADRGLNYDANKKYQEVLERIEHAKELEYIANALYTDFVNSMGTR